MGNKHPKADKTTGEALAPPGPADEKNVPSLLEKDVGLVRDVERVAAAHRKWHCEICQVRRSVIPVIPPVFFVILDIIRRMGHCCGLDCGAGDSFYAKELAALVTLFLVPFTLKCEDDHHTTLCGALEASLVISTEDDGCGLCELNFIAPSGAGEVSAV